MRNEAIMEWVKCVCVQIFIFVQILWNETCFYKPQTWFLKACGLETCSLTITKLFESHHKSYHWPENAYMDDSRLLDNMCLTVLLYGQLAGQTHHFN